MGVRDEGWFGQPIVARPEARQTLLLFGADGHPAPWPFARWRRSTRVARRRQVERALPEVDRAALTDKRRPIRLEYARNADQDSPAAVHVQWIVGSVRVVLVERNLIVDFDWMCVDCHMDSERLQLCHELEVEVGDRARDQRHTAGAAVGGRGGQLVFDQVEVDLEDTLADRNHRGGQPPSRHRECDTPPFIEKWRELELHLADDLQPHVQRRERGLPVLVRQRWPHWIIVSSSHRAAPPLLIQNSAPTVTAILLIESSCMSQVIDPTTTNRCPPQEPSPPGGNFSFANIRRRNIAAETGTTDPHSPTPGDGSAKGRQAEPGAVSS